MSLEADGGAQLEIVVPRLGELIGQVGPDDMDRSTPCEDWTVRDLLNHIVGGAQMFCGAFNGDAMQDISGRMPDVVGDDPAGAFGATAEAFGASVALPGAMEREYAMPFGPMDGPTVLRYLAFDLSIHTWDLASALGSDVGLPDDLIAEVDRFGRRVLGGWSRDGINFQEAVAPPDGADTLERLVAFTGRRVPVRTG
ncbi:MAG: TIGR03086 family metal-binding protein [Acidimicrobiales bacterium]